MKDNGQCPRCSSKEVALLGGRTYMSKVYVRPDPTSDFSEVAKYACTDCGYVMEHLIDPEELAALKETI